MKACTKRHKINISRKELVQDTMVKNVTKSEILRILTIFRENIFLKKIIF